MSTEVYLLSIPLTRHRSIVPRRRDVGVVAAGTHMRPVEQRVFGIADAVVEFPPHAGSRQRIDTH
jgi:hypothetical protein